MPVSFCFHERSWSGAFASNRKYKNPSFRLPVPVHRRRAFCAVPNSRENRKGSIQSPEKLVAFSEVQSAVAIERKGNCRSILRV